MNKVSPGELVSRPVSIAALLLLTLWASCSAAFFSQSVPSITMEASAGFKAGGAEYFLLHLLVYYKAKGFAAFPDGGTPKTVVDRVYLVKPDGAGVRTVSEISTPPGFSGVYFKSSKIRADKNGLLIRLPWYDKKTSAEKPQYIFFEPSAAKTYEVADPGGEWPKEIRSLSETNRSFRDFSDFDAAGLPNPLDYAPGADKPEELAGIISKGLGERRLRLAAARRLMASGNERLLRAAIADLDKIAASRKIYFWSEEKALLEVLSATPVKKKGE